MIIKNGLKDLLGKVGSWDNASKLSEDQANELISLRATGVTYLELAKIFKIGTSTVGHLVKSTS